MNSKSDFEIISHILFRMLTREPNPLPEGTILKKAHTLKSILATDEGLKLYAFDTGKDDLQNLHDDDWIRLISDLEKRFNVKMEIGKIVQGDKQQKRDNTWWTGFSKGQSENFYWNRYLKQELEVEYTPIVVKTINDDTDVILNNIGNPSAENFDRYGMVVGHVQSGKTANYTGLICKAADAGYKFIIVIAGGLNNLRNQTQERINKNFVGRSGDEYIGVGIGNNDNSKLPWSLTTETEDFDIKTAERLAQGGNFDNITSPVIIVIKKHSKTLSNVKKWLNSHYVNKINHPILVIDDESDYASVNTKEEDDPATINKKIRELLNLFNKRTYVSYTATPFANIFIDHKATNDQYGKDLFPRDFIYTLDAPTNYLGARKIFIENPDKHLVNINDYLDDIPDKHKKDYDLVALPISLQEAIRLFYINIAIREIRGQVKKHNSMLIHVSRFTNMHMQISLLINEYLNSIKNEFLNFGKLEDCEKIGAIIKDTQETYKKFYSNIPINWRTVCLTITDIISSIVIREAHQSSKIPLEYRKDVNTNAIVIGGTSLSRGYTLEGLSVSYFLRNTLFFDTLMQMGRWFGYRIGYEDLCKIFMPSIISDNFTEIIETTEDLFEEFKLMSSSGSTPEKYGLAIKQHPGSILQVTGRNKQKHIQKFTHIINLNGQLKETRWVLSDKESVQANYKAFCNLIESLNTDYKPLGNNFLWVGIKNDVVKSFVREFTHFIMESDPLGLRSKMPVKAIQQYIDSTLYWDVALYSGTGKESLALTGAEFKRPIRTVKRKITAGGREYFEIGQRQLSSASDEGLPLRLGNDDYKHFSRKEDRRLREKYNGNPLLMIYLLEAKVEDDESSLLDIVAYGISFPGTALSTGHEVKLLINTVYYEDLLELENEED
jgi:hypothetical protein